VPLIGNIDIDAFGLHFSQASAVFRFFHLAESGYSDGHKLLQKYEKYAETLKIS
jgi:hypothetical protein